ncbi:RNB domain-containing ribonuclease [Sphingomonas alba]|uniref:RNB domain-containing ribonuclease n=1 Tax=Sphingomonas alba TaxID=2908208 RepID=A0ABT0RNS1_9SPHN|nr:RNB domain-containing ribonuclease [Sphingomonas alba]MCL6684302.1 RNB domain-containing ribonuclease [Sphingomonas alba]
MRLIDSEGALARGLSDIRTQFQVPAGFPAEVVAAAQSAKDHYAASRADWTATPFVTLDPASSTDLDQAFALARDGNDIVLHYAIADVGAVVADGDPIDTEAWARGTTIYLPDGKASLYPPILSEGSASLLPDVDRPAVVFTVRVDEAGNSRLDGAVRGLIRSRAKLAYETVTPSDLSPEFTELSRRIALAEDARGAERVDAPEQELVPDGGDGQFDLVILPQLESEQQNAALSLAANLAIADALFAHHTGLFRVMAGPGDWAVRRLRHTAKALGLIWPKDATLAQFERTLDGTNPSHAAFRSAIRRASPGATYAPFTPGAVPWHSAMAATYVHATAPLRRLADRFVIEAALAVANGQPVPDTLTASFAKLPEVMADADNRAAQVERAALDLAEAVMLKGREGSRFDAVVTDVDERGARIQLCEPPVVARIDAKDLLPGAALKVELVSADATTRQVRFRRVS